MKTLSSEQPPILFAMPKEYVTLGKRLFNQIKDNAYVTLGTVNVIMELEAFFYTYFFLEDEGIMITRVLNTMNPIQKFLIACYVATLEITETKYPTAFGKL